MSSRLRTFLLLVVIISIFSLPARAQSVVSLVGAIKTKDGSTLPGVTVSLRCKCTKQCPSDPDCSCCPATKTFVTDEKGNFHFDGLPAGEYQVDAELGGFTPASRTVAVTVGGQNYVEIVMGRGESGVDPSEALD